MAVVGIAAVILALMLTSVDDATVRFMTITGHGSGRIILRHVAGLTSFLVVAVPGCWVTVGPIAAGITATAGVAMLLLLTLRILGYRLHSRRFADFLVSILAGLVMLVAYAMPIALPVLILAMLWRLQRRAKATTWLLT